MPRSGLLAKMGCMLVSYKPLDNPGSPKIVSAGQKQLAGQAQALEHINSSVSSPAVGAVSFGQLSLLCPDSCWHCWPSRRRRDGGRAANADLEGAIRDAYVDKHQVHHGRISVEAVKLEFLEAGPRTPPKRVLPRRGVLDDHQGGNVGVRRCGRRRGMRLSP